MKNTTVAVTDNDVEKYQKLYRARYGIVIDKVMATRHLYMLLRQMQVVYRPITVQQVKQLENEKRDDYEPEPASRS